MGLVTTDSNLILTGASDSNPLFPAGLADLSATGQDAGLGQEGESYATGTDLVGENYAPPEIGDGAMAGYIDTIMGDASRRRKRGAGEDDSADPFAPAYVPLTDKTPTPTVVVTPPAGPANNAPVLGAAAYNVAENTGPGTIIGAIPVSDADGDPVTLTLTGTTYPGAVSVVGGNIVVAGPIDFEAVPSFTITVQADDGKGGVTSRTYTIGVTDVAENAATIAGVAGPGINTLDATDVNPFAAAVVNHPDPLAILTATVTVDDATKGVLSGAGVTDLGGGVYRITGTAAQVQTALRAAVENSTDSRLNATGQVDAAVWTVTITDGSGGSSTQSVTVNATQAIDSANQDSFVLPFNIAAGAMTGGAGYDVVQLQAGSNTFSMDTNLVQPEIMDQIDEIQGTTSNDTLTFDGVANTNHMFIDLGGGWDTINLNGDAVVELSGVEMISSTAGSQSIGLWTTGFVGGDLGADPLDEVFFGSAGAYNFFLGGVDRFVFDNASADVTMGYSLTGQDVESTANGGILRLSGVLDTLGHVQDMGYIVADNGDQNVTVTGGISGATPVVFTLGFGNDTLNVSGTSFFKAEYIETINGLDATDKTLILGNSYNPGGTAAINFGGGNDTVTLDQPMTVNLSLTGVETLYGAGAAGSIDITLLNNQNGLDIHSMGGGNDIIRLAGGANTLGSIDAIEHVYGTGGADDLTVTDITNTTVELGGGNDRLMITGNGGVFTNLYGGLGADTLGLIMNTAGVRWHDFDATQGDKIDVSGTGLTAGQIDLDHVRLRPVGFQDIRMIIEVDSDGLGAGSTWQQVGEIWYGKSLGGEMNGDGVGDPLSQAQADAVTQDLINSGQITA